MGLGSTQPLTEMSTRSISWGQRRSVRKADKLTTTLSRNLGTLTSSNPLGPSGPVTGLLYFFTQLNMTWLSWFFSVPPTSIVHKIRKRPIIRTLFPVQHSPLILPFNTMWSEILTSAAKCVNQFICKTLLYYGGNDIKHYGLFRVLSLLLSLFNEFSSTVCVMRQVDVERRRQEWEGRKMLSSTEGNFLKL